jgi:hypothetical protein
MGRPCSSPRPRHCPSWTNHQHAPARVRPVFACVTTVARWPALLRQLFFSIETPRLPCEANLSTSSIPADPCAAAWPGRANWMAVSPEHAAAALESRPSVGSPKKLSVFAPLPLHIPHSQPTKGTFQRHLVRSSSRCETAALHKHSLQSRFMKTPSGRLPCEPSFQVRAVGTFGR